MTTDSNRPAPRPGQVWWNARAMRYAIVYGRALHDQWRVMTFPPSNISGSSGFRYGRWRRVPEGYDLIKEPSR